MERGRRGEAGVQVHDGSVYILRLSLSVPIYLIRTSVARRQGGRRDERKVVVGSWREGAVTCGCLVLLPRLLVHGALSLPIIEYHIPFHKI